VRDETLTSAQQEREAEKRRLHSETAEAIVASIRSRPGLERFLMLPAFTSIVQSIPKGFVVLLNVSELGYHALIMDGCARSVFSVSLNLPARIVGSKRNEVQHSLSRGAKTAESEVSDDEPFAIGEKEEGARASGVRERVIRTFEDSLADLWIFVVRPVIDAVQLNVSWTTYSILEPVLIIYRRGRTVATGPVFGGVPPVVSLSAPYMLPVATLRQRASA
jgi:hypothetical protein